MNLQEIEAFLSSQTVFKENKKLFDFSNLRPSHLFQGHYAFNLRVLSTKTLAFFQTNEVFEDVIFYPSAPPPGKAADSISHRYTVHVKLKSTD